jgi:hypothetical protein
MTQCTATSKRTRERCRAQAITGRTVCRHHGGKTPLGPASPHWVDGRFSRILPKRLLDDYLTSLNDPEKLALEAELAVIDARIKDVLSRVDSGESGRLWSELRVAWDSSAATRRAGDLDEMDVRLRVVGELITAGHTDWAAWADVLNLIRDRQRLVESERKRLVEAQQVISVDQAMAVLGLLVDAVRRHVRDDAVLRAISGEYARLTGTPIPTEPPPGIPSPRRKRHDA